MDTNLFPGERIAVNIEYRHNDEIHLVQHLSHTWVSSIFWDDLQTKMNQVFHTEHTIHFSRISSK